MKKIFFFLLVMALFVGCSSKPTIDTSTDEKMKSSIEKVRQSLPEEKRDDFDKAIQVLAFSNIDLKDLFALGSTGAGTTEAKIKESLHGKTGAEVIAAADEIIKEQKEKERLQALQEIKELEGKKIAAEKAKEDLSKFEVLRSRFYKRKQEFFGEQPIIEITVKNGTRQPVSRAYFVGTLASPNRSVPWLKESFNYSISGGLEPGEQATWKLSPNMFSEWGKVEAPKDSVFTVEVERLDGAGGETLFSTMGFTKEDEKRLTELKKQYGM